MKKLIDLIVIGAGNPDIIRLIEDINNNEKKYNFIGFLEQNNNMIGQNILGYQILGNDDLLNNEFKNCSVVNNVMNTTVIHQKVTEKLKRKFGVTHFPNLIHPSVNTKYVSFGEGNIVYENVNFGVLSSIGNFNIFYPYTLIGHQAIIENFCLLAGAVLVSARTTIRDRVFMGNRSIVIPNKYIASDVFIGAGSVVIRSLKKKKKIFGNPAKTLCV